jgi:hypothetical protein
VSRGDAGNPAWANDSCPGTGWRRRPDSNRGTGKSGVALVRKPQVTVLMGPAAPIPIRGKPRHSRGMELGSMRTTPRNREGTRSGRSTRPSRSCFRAVYFPDWLLEPRRRAERALTQVVAQCYVRGVSIRRVEAAAVPRRPPSSILCEVPDPGPGQVTASRTTTNRT